MNNDYYVPTRSQMRHDYAHCGYVYPCKSHWLMSVVRVVACIAVFAAIGVMLGWRG